MAALFNSTTNNKISMRVRTTVIGGLLVSTLITLFVVPVLYSIIERKGDQAKLEQIRKNFVFVDINLDD